MEILSRAGAAQIEAQDRLDHGLLRGLIQPSVISVSSVVQIFVIRDWDVLDAKLGLGRNLDANRFQFASKNKSMHHNHLAIVSTILGRFGRKFPEHFIGEGAACRRSCDNAAGQAAWWRASKGATANNP